jgi:hypothetical protein
LARRILAGLHARLLGVHKLLLFFISKAVQLDGLCNSNLFLAKSVPEAEFVAASAAAGKVD